MNCFRAVWPNDALIFTSLNFSVATKHGPFRVCNKFHIIYLFSKTESAAEGTDHDFTSRYFGSDRHLCVVGPHNCLAAVANALLSLARCTTFNTPGESNARHEFLCAGICLLVIAAAFVLWIRHKSRNTGDQNTQDRKIRLGIIQTEAYLAEEQTLKFEAAMTSQQKPKKRTKQKTVRTVKYGDRRRTARPDSSSAAL